MVPPLHPPCYTSPADIVSGGVFSLRGQGIQAVEAISVTYLIRHILREGGDDA